MRNCIFCGHFYIDSLYNFLTLFTLFRREKREYHTSDTRFVDSLWRAAGGGGAEPDVGARQDAGHRGRERQREEREHAGADGAAAQAGVCQRTCLAQALSTPHPCGELPCLRGAAVGSVDPRRGGLPQHPRQAHRHDFSGAHDEPQPRAEVRRAGVGDAFIAT